MPLILEIDNQQLNKDCLEDMKRDIKSKIKKNYIHEIGITGDEFNAIKDAPTTNEFFEILANKLTKDITDKKIFTPDTLHTWLYLFGLIENTYNANYSEHAKHAYRQKMDEILS